MTRRYPGAWRRLVWLAALAVTATPAPAGATEVALQELVQGMPARYAAIRDYTTIMVMQERDGAAPSPPEQVEVKFARPFKVFLRWTDGPGKGRRILYVEGRNGDRMLVRERGLLGLTAVWLDPHGIIARAGSKRPVTDVGIGVLVARVGPALERGLREGRLRDGGIETQAGRSTRRLELAPSPSDLDQATTQILWVDTELGVPVQYEQIDPTGRPLEHYAYTELRPNVGLTESDFDPRNPDYGF